MRLFRWIVGSLVFFNVFDALSTLVFVGFLQARELNPFMATLLEFSPGAFLVAKLGYTGLAASLAWSNRDQPSVVPVTICVTFAYLLLFIYQITLIVLGMP